MMNWQAAAHDNKELRPNICGINQKADRGNQDEYNSGWDWSVFIAAIRKTLVATLLFPLHVSTLNEKGACEAIDKLISNLAFCSSINFLFYMKIETLVALPLQNICKTASRNSFILAKKTIGFTKLLTRTKNSTQGVLKNR